MNEGSQPGGPPPVGCGSKISFLERVFPCSGNRRYSAERKDVEYLPSLARVDFRQDETVTETNSESVPSGQSTSSALVGIRRYSTRFPTQWLSSTIAYLSKTTTCSVDYLAYHGPEEAELSLWTGFMQEAASGLRRIPLLRG
jgi:hypothetical protein